MNEPWFDGNMFGAIVGSSIGVFGGVWGGLVGFFARKGKYKTALVSLGATFLIAGFVFLVLGITALWVHQPFPVWYSLVLCGGILTTVLSFQVPLVLYVYRQAEERKMQAKDLG